MDGVRLILKVAWAILTDDLDILEERKSGESRITTGFWLGQLD